MFIHEKMEKIPTETSPIFYEVSQMAKAGLSGRHGMNVPLIVYVLEHLGRNFRKQSVLN